MYRLTVVYDEPADKEAVRPPLHRRARPPRQCRARGWAASSHLQGGTPYPVAELFWPSEDAFKASAAPPEMAGTRKHAEGGGTTFMVCTGDVAGV